MFESKKFSLPDKVAYKKNLKKKSQFWTDLKEFMDEKDVVCEEVIVNGFKYHKGDLVVIKVLDGGDKLKVGIIKTILLKGSDIYFVNSQYVAKKDFLGYFESSEIDTEIVFSKSSSLADDKPLIMRGTLAKFVFVLHHHISFDYIGNL